MVFCAAAALYLFWQTPKAPRRTVARVKTAPIALSPLAARNAAQRLANLGWGFEPNVGQTGANVKFLARANDATVFLTDDSVYVSWKQPARANQRDEAGKRDFLRLEFAGARRDAKQDGDILLGGKTNYLIGRDPRKWHTDIPHYAAVRYAGLYPGVDARFYGGAQGLEYDLTAVRGSDLQQILLRVSGADALRLDRQGNLVMRIGVRELTMRRPCMYQLDGGARKSVTGGYRLLSGNEVGFEVGNYRAGLPLVIDPSISIAYTTFLGGNGAEMGNSVAVGSSGDIFVGGTTTDVTTFPETTTCNDIKSTTCGGSSSGATSNLFVAKIDPSKSGSASLIYLTFIGGSGNDQGGMVAVDNSASPRRLAILGWTTSTDFPTTIGSVPTGAVNLTVSKLNGAGNGFIYSEYFGGSGAEATQGTGAIVTNSTGGGIATDSSGDVFVTSDTTSIDLPQPASPNGFQTLFEGTGTASTAPNSDGFFAEFNSSGSLIYSTYFGISAQVGSTSVAVDATGNAYIAGFTSSPATFPFVNAFQTTYGGTGAFNGFVMEVNPVASGTTSLLYASLLGGNGSDQAFAIAVDTASPANAYVTGTTSSTDFVSKTGLTNPFQSNLGSGATSNAFLAVVSQTSTTFVPSLTYVSYLGGTATDSGQGIAVNSSVTPSQVIVAGDTTSNGFPVLCTAQNFTGGEDAFIAEFNPAASGSTSLTISTLLGGSATSEANGLAADSSGDAIIFGDTLSPDYPLAGNPQTGVQLTCTSCTFGTPLSDAFLTKSALSTTASGCLAFSPASATFGSFSVGSTTVPPISVLVTNDGNAALTFSGIGIIGNNAADFQLLTGTSCTATTVLTPSGPGSSCDLAIGFTPSVGASETATVQFTDDGAGSPQGLDLSGTGTAPEVMLTTSPPTSPPAVTFGSVTVNTTSGAQDVTLTNTGNVTLAISSVVIDSSVGNPADFIVNPAGTANACGTVGANSIAPNGTCTVAVEFAPNATGPLTGQVDVNDNAGNSSAAQQTIALSGTGVAQTFIVGVSPMSLSFPSQNVGATSSPQSVTLTNSGTGTLNITSIGLTGTNANQFQIYSAGTTCLIGGAGVGPNGGTCTVAVEFAPTVVGAASASVNIADNSPTSPQTVPLTGTGGGAVATLSASTLTFGSVSVGNTSAAQTVTLTNNGNSSLILSSLGISGANPSDFQIMSQSTCPIGGTGIAPLESCSIAVDFVPQASGSRFATVNIADNAAGSPQIISLNGTGTAPVATLSETSLSFGNVNVGDTSTLPSITLTNTGNQTLMISSVTIDPTVGTPGDFALSGSNTCETVGTLQPSTNCAITVSFTPALQGGAIGRVDIADNASGSPQTVLLTGTGTAAGVVLTPSILTFAGQNPGTPASPPQTVTLQNNGTGPLTISSIAITGTNPGDFTQTNNCPIGSATSLAAGKACSIAVTFAPTGTGSRSASLSVSDSSIPSPQVVALSGIGTVPGAEFSVSGIGLQFGTVIVGAKSSSQTAQLTNTGNGTLVITKVGFVGANPGDFQASGSCVGAGGASVSVAAGSNCMVNVIFAPTAAGSRSANINMTDNAPSSPEQLPVTGTATDFQLGAVSGGSTSATVTAGETATFSLQIASLNGFTGTVAMSSSNPIPASKCTISPAQVVVSGQAAGFTATVTTTAPTTTSGNPFFTPPASKGLRLVIGLWLLAFALLALWKRKSRRRLRFRSALLLAGVLLVASCGGGGGSSSPTGTPAGAYTITITGAVSGVSRTVNLSLTVQ
jgi:hypothetical protein